MIKIFPIMQKNAKWNLSILLRKLQLKLTNFKNSNLSNTKIISICKDDVSDITIVDSPRRHYLKI